MRGRHSDLASFFFLNLQQYIHTQTQHLIYQRYEVACFNRATIFRCAVNNATLGVLEKREFVPFLL